MGTKPETIIADRRPVGDPVFWHDHGRSTMANVAKLTPDQLHDRLISAGLAGESDLLPCTDVEIEQIESNLDRPLPTSYVGFLKTIGRGAGDFMSDLSIFYPQLMDNTKTMRQLLVEEGVDLPPDAFVFVHRYGEQMLFFRLGQSDNDPPIYRWSNEEPTAFTRVFDSLWDFLEEELSGHEYMNQ